MRKNYELLTPRRPTPKWIQPALIALFSFTAGLSVNVNWQDIFYAAYYFCGVGG
jgi:hypothetical protein